MATYQLKCVGAFHRPPAKALINMTIGGTRVWLQKEPTNAFDPNAIKILLPSESIPADQFDEQAAALAGYGHDRDSVLAIPLHHIGYIPAKDAIWLARKLGDEDHPAELHFDHNGAPTIHLEIQE